MRIRATSTVITEPVSATEAKNFLKQVETLPTAEENLILSMIKTAREYIERYIGSSLVSKTYEMIFSVDELEDRTIEIPYPPFISVQKVEMESYDGTRTELTSGSDYYLTGNDKKTIQVNTSTISLTDYKCNYIVSFTAGYTGTNLIPEPLKIAILQQVLIWYERDGTFEPTLSSQVKMICSEYTEKSSLQ